MKNKTNDANAWLGRLDQAIGAMAVAESDGQLLNCVAEFLQPMEAIESVCIAVFKGGEPATLSTTAVFDLFSSANRSAAQQVTNRTWFIQRGASAEAPRAAAGAGYNLSGPLRPATVVPFAVAPGVCGVLLPFTPADAQWKEDSDSPMVEALRIIAASFGAHLTRIDRQLAAAAARKTEPSWPFRFVSTGLLDRAAFAERLEALTRPAAGRPGRCAVLAFNLHRFSRIEDAWGDCLADHMVREVAARVSDGVAGYALMAQLRSDEFALAVTDDPSRGVLDDRVKEMSMTLRNLFAAPFLIDNRQVFLTPAIGVAMFPEHGENAQRLVKHARYAMYRAGRDTHDDALFFEPSMSERSMERLDMETAVRRLVASGNLDAEMRVVYQPQVNLSTMRLCGAEALLRWRSPHFGDVPPAVLVPLLEETGLIVPVGRWVLESACRQVREWADQGVRVERLAVNLSSKQLKHPATVETLRKVMVDTGVMAWSQLEMEITETTLMDDAPSTLTHLNELARMGVKISVDDFGIGYSSLAYLRRFPLSALKVDRLFLSDLDADPQHAQLTRAMIELGHSLNLRVIAEGVETEAQLRFVKEHGCEEGQGFLFARPIEAKSFGDSAARSYH